MRENKEALGTLTITQDLYNKFPSPDNFSPKSKPRNQRIQD